MCRKLQPSNAESTGSRGGLCSGSRLQQRKEEGEGDSLPLVFYLFHRIFDSCHSFITFTVLFWHFHMMVVMIRVGFRGHSLHLISWSIENYQAL